MEEDGQGVERLGMRTGMKTAMAVERGDREGVGWMCRANWMGKQQREGRGRQDEIVRVEWQENERG